MAHVYLYRDFKGLCRYNSATLIKGFSMIKEHIITKLNAAFSVSFLQVENESHKHSVPENSETHFKVVLVTDDFKGLNKVKQHQAVYQVLKQELAGEVHALALHTYTHDAWQQTLSAPQSPDCLGGGQ